MTSGLKTSHFLPASYNQKHISQTVKAADANFTQNNISVCTEQRAVTSNTDLIMNAVSLMQMIERVTQHTAPNLKIQS